MAEFYSDMLDIDSSLMPSFEAWHINFVKEDLIDWYTCSNMVHVLDVDECEYINKTEECEKFIYLDYLYCHDHHWIQFTIMALKYIIFGLFLYVNTETILAPCSAIITSSMNIDQHLFGATVLTFFLNFKHLTFWTTVLLNSTKNLVRLTTQEYYEFNLSMRVELRVEEVLGRSILMATLCHGLIILVNPFTSSGPFCVMQNVLSAVGTYWLTCVVYEQYATMKGATGCLSLYYAYQLINVGFHLSKFYYWPPKVASTIQTVDRSQPEESSRTNLYEQFWTIMIERHHGRNVVVEATWGTLSIWKKITFCIFFVPRSLMMIFQFSCDQEHRTMKCSTWMTIVNVYCAPPILIYTMDLIWDLDLHHSWMATVYYGIGVCVSWAVAKLFQQRMRTNQLADDFFFAFACAGFLTSTSFVYISFLYLQPFLASMFLTAFENREALVLVPVALGNALPDIITLVTLALCGYSAMASASCYGAILSNILWGVAYFYYKQIEPKYGDDEKIDGNEVRFRPLAFLAGSPVFAFGVSVTMTLWTLINGCQYRRGTGIGLIVLYGYYVLTVWYQDVDIIHGFSDDYENSNQNVPQYPYIPPYNHTFCFFC